MGEPATCVKVREKGDLHLVIRAWVIERVLKNVRGPGVVAPVCEDLRPESLVMNGRQGRKVPWGDIGPDRIREHRSGERLSPTPKEELT